jgi:hypothetical protein
MPRAREKDRPVRIAPRTCVLLVLLLSAATLGCSDGRPRRMPVAGQVLIDGEPLTTGYVRFVPADARSSGSPIGPDGRFRLTCFEDEDGAVPGTHKVAVDGGEVLGPDTKRWNAPKKYADYETSGLTVEIDGPTDTLVIELSWDGGEPFVEQQQPEAGLDLLAPEGRTPD